jgi:hypothetical protein
MLVEPPEDEARLALDRAVAEAVAARIAAGPRPGPDADAIALRTLLADTPAAARASVRKRRCTSSSAETPARSTFTATCRPVHVCSPR